MEISRKLIKELKDKGNCDYIIALTHMRIPRERNLAKNVPEIDFIFGGHDHVYH